MKEFQGKVAVVTGAASGIGRALAERCAQEGMKVVLADKAAISSSGGHTAVHGASPARCDAPPTTRRYRL